MGGSLNVWIPVHTKYTCILLFDICVFFHLYKSLFPYCELTPSRSWGSNPYSLVMELFDIWQDALTTIDLPGRTWEKRMTVDTNDLSSWNGRVLETRRKLTQNWQNFLTLKFEAIYPWSFSPNSCPWCSGTVGWSILFSCAFPIEAHPGGIWREANNQRGRWGLWRVPQAIPTNWDVSMGPGWRVTNVQHTLLLNNACRCMASNFDGQRVIVHCYIDYIDDW